MTTYRLFPSTNGPATAVTNSGPFLSGVIFTLTGGGCWIDGYWWWVCGSNQSTSPVKCALWSITNQNGGEVVPGSVITSGTLTAGQWNYIPLTAPVQLAPGFSPNISTSNTSGYLAAIGCNGSFPDTNGFWASGPVSNGPLTAYGNANGPSGAGSPPYNLSQGVYTTAGSDPSTTMPNGASGTDNFWVDVQIDTVAPASYAGTYRLWPNKADANASTGGDAPVDYVVATEIDTTVPLTLNNIWYYSPSAAITLATACNVWSISSGLSVASIPSPSWKIDTGAAFTAGTTPYGGNGTWIKAAFAAGITLPAGQYRVSVYNSNGTSDGSWSPKDANTNYWQAGASGGVGNSGISWGLMAAPNQSTAQSGTFYPGSGTGSTGAQPVFAYSGSNVFPLYTTGLNPAQNYWVDLEATQIPAATAPPPPFLAPMRLT